VRIRAAIVTAAILLASTVASLTGASAASACTCGALVAPPDVEVAGPEVRAVSRFAHGVQTVEMMIDAGTTAPSIGLIVATPEPAKTGPGDPAVFEALERTIGPERVIVDDWWGRRSAEPEAAPERPTRPVTVEDRTIPAAATDSLGRWSDTTGFRVPKSVRTRIADYAQQGWSLSLLTLTLDPAAPGELAPIRFSFESPQAIVPLMLTGAETRSSTMRLYVLDEHRAALVRADDEAPLDAAQSVVWAAPTTGTDVAALAPYLTVFDVRLDAPRRQATADIVVVHEIADTPSIARVLVYRPLELLGMPLGWVLLAWAGAGVVLLVLYLAYRLRSR
jgi:hypothetical protein